MSSVIRRIEKTNSLVNACLLLFFLLSCAGEKGGQQPPASTATGEGISADTLPEDEEVWLGEENLKPMADGLFEDFLLNFATDSSLQRQRIVFPLPLQGEDADRLISSEEWERGHPFGRLESYVTLYDNEEEMEMEKDTSLHTVAVECIHAAADKYQCYDFVRKEGLWSLVGIRVHSLSECANSGFARFLWQFVSDSLFQRNHVSEPLPLVTIDPEDDFNILEATIDAEQWVAFAPPMPGEVLVNINYGQRYLKRPGMKIMLLKGLGNGFCNALYFRRHGDSWMLARYEDVGN